MELTIAANDIIPVRALKDNYIWTILDREHQRAFVVDPGDAKPVIDTLNQLQFSLGGILLTHHHADHSGGIAELKDYAGDIPVFASHLSKVKGVNHPVKDGDEIIIHPFKLKAMAIPGHTLDHTAYYIDKCLVFSGDTLFSGGCGRIFEGTPEMMFASLNKLLRLSDSTRLYCGHEYTVANLRFSQTVEPNNKAIATKIAEALAIENKGGCTLPSTLGDQRHINAFLRSEAPDVITAAEHHSGKKLSTPLEVFTAIREWKNNWS